MKIKTIIADAFNALVGKAINAIDAYDAYRKEHGPGRIERRARKLQDQWNTVRQTIADPAGQFVKQVQTAMQENLPVGSLFTSYQPHLTTDQLYVLTGMAVQHRRADVLEVLSKLEGFRENLDIRAASDAIKYTHAEFATKLGYSEIAAKLTELKARLDLCSQKAVVQKSGASPSEIAPAA